MQVFIHFEWDYNHRPHFIKMLKLTVKHKDTAHSLESEPSRTVGDLKQQLQTAIRIPVIQQELSCKLGDQKKVFSDDSMPLQLAGISPATELSVKNLGPQIKWNYVFYIEYAGPILIFPLLYLLGKRDQYNEIQCLALIMTILHYLKREYETAFVHVFSRVSMPFKRVFINSIHYWVFFGLFNAVELYFFPDGHSYSTLTLALIFLGWAGVEFCNFQCHKILSSFRQKKSKADGEYVNESKQRGIPYGWGFNQVSCANYFWEALGWILFSVLTRTWSAYLFTGLSIYQMLDWALKKHKNYKREFGDKYPKGRKAMFPFII